MKNTTLSLVLGSILFFGSVSMGQQDKVKKDDGINQKYWSLLKVRHVSKGIAQANPVFKNFGHATILFNDDFIKINIFENSVSCQALGCSSNSDSMKSIKLPVVKKIVEGCYDIHLAEQSSSGVVAVQEAILVERFASERCDARLDTRQGKAQYLIKGLVSSSNKVETLGILFDLSQVIEVIEQKPVPLPYPTPIEK